MTLREMSVVLVMIVGWCLMLAGFGSMILKPEEGEVVAFVGCGILATGSVTILRMGS